LKLSCCWRRFSTIKIVRVEAHFSCRGEGYPNRQVASFEDVPVDNHWKDTVEDHPITNRLSSLLKNSECRLLKKTQRQGGNYKDESGNVKAEFNFQLS
jgi:hypothetical protein